MTCATCHGRGVYSAWVTEFSYRPGDPPRDMAAADKGKQLAPCPDCTPKPFAEVTVDRSNYAVLRIAGEWVEEAAEAVGGDELRRIAAAINTAVEAREAKLRGDREILRAALADLVDRQLNSRCLVKDEPCFDPACCTEGRVRSTLARVDEAEYVSGDVACGLAWDVGAMQAKVEGSWGVLLDVMFDKGGEAGELAWELAGLVGVRHTSRGTPVKVLFPSPFTDSELRAECQRRGIRLGDWSDPPLRVDLARTPSVGVAALVQGRQVVRISNIESVDDEGFETPGRLLLRSMCPTCNDMPYDGATGREACPACGQRR